MAFLTAAVSTLADVTVKAPGGFWVIIINLFRSFITDYGWCVIVFTVALRLILLPLDFFQKKVAYDNKKKTEAMEPYMEKLRKQYGNDRMAMSQKQRELQKKFKISTFAPCLPAILSMVIFITLFTGFRQIADFEIYTAYNDTRTAYVSSYVDESQEKYDAMAAYYQKSLDAFGINKTVELAKSEFDAFHLADKTVSTKFEIKNSDLKAVLTNENDPDAPLKDKKNIYDALLIAMAQEAAVDEYETHKEDMSFLWIKNMWRPDVVWGMDGCNFTGMQPVIPTAADYKKALTSGNMKEYKAQASIDKEYGMVMDKVIAANNFTANGGKVYNGYYILAVIIVGLSFLSTKFNAAGNIASAPQAAAGSGQPGMPNMKMMMYIMPIMMAFFAISSNSAFSLYMVASTGTSLLSTLLCNFSIKKYDKYKTAKAEENQFRRYESTGSDNRTDNKGGKKK